MGDSFMSETFSQEFVTTYKRFFSSSSPPLFFFPINGNQTRGVRACGCDGEMGAGFFCSSSLEKIVWCSIPSSKAWVLGEKLLPAAEKARQERGRVSPSIPHHGPCRIDPILGTPKHLWALEAA